MSAEIRIVRCDRCGNEISQEMPKEKAFRAAIVQQTDQALRDHRCKPGGNAAPPRTGDVGGVPVVRA